MEPTLVIILDLNTLTFHVCVCVCVGRSGLAWLACGPHLEVVHAVTGERLSAYCFSGGGEHPPSVLAARDFSWLKRSELCFTISFLSLFDSIRTLSYFALQLLHNLIVINGNKTCDECYWTASIICYKERF